MNVKVKFIGKVNHTVEGMVCEPGKEYVVSAKAAEHPFFEKLETPKAKPAPKAEPKEEKEEVVEKPKRTPRTAKTEE